MRSKRKKAAIAALRGRSIIHAFYVHSPRRTVGSVEELAACFDVTNLDNDYEQLEWALNAQMETLVGITVDLAYESRPLTVIAYKFGSRQTNASFTVTFPADLVIFLARLRAIEAEVMAV